MWDTHFQASIGCLWTVEESAIKAYSMSTSRRCRFTTSRTLAMATPWHSSGTRHSRQPREPRTTFVSLRLTSLLSWKMLHQLLDNGVSVFYLNKSLPKITKDPRIYLRRHEERSRDYTSCCCDIFCHSHMLTDVLSLVMSVSEP